MTNLRRVAARVQENPGIVVVALLPLAIFALRARCLEQPGRGRQYLVFFWSLHIISDYRSFDIVFNNYYQTRLPYLIPGAAIFQLFTLSWAKLIFAYLLAAIAIGSLSFALRAHLARPAALLTAVLMTSDVFFVRTISWNYVDNGIVVYYALTIAALTAAAQSPARRSAWVGVAAFCFTSMVFIHLGSAVLGLPALGYAALVLEVEKVGLKRLSQLCLAAALGIAASQCLFGTLNMALWHSDFFFIRTQFLAGSVELAAKPEWRATSEVLRDGDWLAVHLAVWITSTTALVAAALRLVRLTRFQLYCFVSVTVTYGLLYLLDANRLSVFLSRDGLYASFGFILTYMTIGGLVANLDRRMAVAIGMCFVLSLGIRLLLPNGAMIAAVPLPAWLLGVIMSAGLIIALFARNSAIRTIALCLSALPTLLVNTTFGSAQPIYQIHDVIRQAAGEQLPVILTDKNEPLYSNIVGPIVATFTEKAWWAHGPQFPTLPNEAWQKQKIFVISGRLRSLGEMQQLLAPQVDRIEPISFSRNQSRFGELFVGGFEVDRRVESARHHRERRGDVAGDDCRRKFAVTDRRCRRDVAVGHRRAGAGRLLDVRSLCNARARKLRNRDRVRAKRGDADLGHRDEWRAFDCKRCVRADRRGQCQGDRAVRRAKCRQRAPGAFFVFGNGPPDRAVDQHPRAQLS